MSVPLITHQNNDFSRWTELSHIVRICWKRDSLFTTFWINDYRSSRSSADAFECVQVDWPEYRWGRWRNNIPHHSKDKTYTKSRRSPSRNRALLASRTKVCIREFQQTLKKTFYASFCNLFLYACIEKHGVYCIMRSLGGPVLMGTVSRLSLINSCIDLEI